MVPGRRAPSVLAVLVAAALTGCASAPQERAGEEWISPLHRDHPLAGRTWQPSDQRFVTEATVNEALQVADFVLIGEKHNNADHHRHQVRLLRALLRQGRRPAIVFEMLTEDQQAPLDAYLAGDPDDAAGLGEAVGWERRGWPAWAMYRPIADAALARNAPLLAGGLNRKTTRAIASQGVDALGSDRVQRLQLDQPLGGAMRAAMRSEIHESHCRQLPEHMLDPMVTVTLAKDAAMAEAMIRGRALPERDASVLIAGTGHVRHDRGVAWHLRRLAPAARIVAIGLVEVVPDESDAAGYAAAFGDELPFDFVWFAPRVDDDDPCEVFADQLRRARNRAVPGANAGDN